MTSLSKKVTDLLSAFEKENEQKLKERLLQLLTDDDRKIEPDILNPQTPIPDLDWFQSLSEIELNCLAKKDFIKGGNCQVMFRALSENKPRELIKFLLQKGFDSIWSSDLFVKRGDMDLIKYYHKNFLKSKFGFMSLNYAILMNREDILSYLLDNSLTAIDDDCQTALNYGVDACFQTSSWKMLQLLTKHHEKYVKAYVKSHLTTSNSEWKRLNLYILSNGFLLWIWDNIYKWTEEDARRIKNPFMCSFFKSN